MKINAINIKMHFRVLLFCILGLSNILYAQINLVPNPSFEVYDTCPNSDGQILRAVPWFQPYTLGSSTDYFNSCTLDTIVNVPSNNIGFQFARSGNAYAGFSPGYLTGNNYREYMEVKIDSALQAGKRYCVSFYVSFSDKSKRATDAIGAYLTPNALFYSFPQFGLLSFQSQIQNPLGNVINDTSIWTLISDTMLAVGGERYITIGNFKQDSLCNSLVNNYGVYFASYYYIDDVSVVLCDSTTGIKSLEEFDFNIFPNPTSDKLNIRISKAVQKDVVMKLYSSMGHLIFIKPFTPEIDIGDLPKGVYFLTVETTSGNVVKKVVKW